MTTQVILVDEHDRPIGEAEKLAAHRAPLLHRAFSIFIFRPTGDLLLQRRAAGKYHSGGLWSNTCCSHPRPGESLEQATAQRLALEMGLTAPLTGLGSVRYDLTLPGGLHESEITHVYAGVTAEHAAPNPDEADAQREIAWDALLREVSAQPECFTPWLRIILERLGGELGRYRQELLMNLAPNPDETIDP